MWRTLSLAWHEWLSSYVKADNERLTAAGSRCRQNLIYENFTWSYGLGDYVKRIHQSVFMCSTYSTMILPQSTNKIIGLWRCHCRCRRHFLKSSLMSSNDVTGNDFVRYFVNCNNYMQNTFVSVFCPQIMRGSFFRYALLFVIFHQSNIPHIYLRLSTHLLESFIIPTLLSVIQSQIVKCTQIYGLWIVKY